jgi:hypothetical protein
MMITLRQNCSCEKVVTQEAVKLFGTAMTLSLLRAQAVVARTADRTRSSSLGRFRARRKGACDLAVF